jgi:hypothetical protein
MPDTGRHRVAEPISGMPDPSGRRQRPQPAIDETPLTKIVLIGAAVTFLSLFIVLPLLAVFVEALRRGVAHYLESFADPDTQAAIRLTLTVAAIAVPLNLVFGLAAAWAIAKFEFAGKSLLITLIDLPFSVSPVVSGLVFVLLFGVQGYFGKAAAPERPRTRRSATAACSPTPRTTGRSTGAIGRPRRSSTGSGSATSCTTIFRRLVGNPVPGMAPWMGLDVFRNIDGGHRPRAGEDHALLHLRPGPHRRRPPPPSGGAFTGTIVIRFRYAEQRAAPQAKAGMRAGGRTSPTGPGTG